MQTTLKGTIIRVHEKVPFVNKETGETSPLAYTLQLMVDEKLSNGALTSEIRNVKLSSEQMGKYKGKEGQTVEVNCKLFSRSDISLSAV